MLARRLTPVLGLALLLAAKAAAADTAITAEEVIACWVGTADASLIELKLPQGVIRTLYTRDIYELRLSDSGRAAELAAKLPELRITLNRGQAVPPPAVRVREMLRLRLDRAREARAQGRPWYTDVIDTLVPNASRNELAARCRDMDVLLRECGRDDGTVEALLREVSLESGALGRIGPHLGTCCLSGTLGGLLGAVLGTAVGFKIKEPSTPAYGIVVWDPGGALVGCPAGCVVGTGVAATIATSSRTGSLIKQHRSRVNDLIRRVNRAVVTAP